MKKSFLLFLLTLLLSSCGMSKMFYDYHAEFDIVLGRVVHTRFPENRRQERVVQVTENNGNPQISGLRFSDENLDISWEMGKDCWFFTLKSNARGAIRILWDEVVYIGIDGISGPVIHSGIEFMDFDLPQEPSVVARNVPLRDYILPVNHLKYDKDWSLNNGWKADQILPHTHVRKAPLIERAEYSVGKGVTIILPFLIEGTVHEYEFSLDILGYKFIDKP